MNKMPDYIKNATNPAPTLEIGGEMEYEPLDKESMHDISESLSESIYKDAFGSEIANKHSPTACLNNAQRIHMCVLLRHQ